MCGHFGIAGDLNSSDRSLFRTLAIVSTLRGEDSAGVLAVPSLKDGEPKIIKTVGTSFDLFSLKAYEDLPFVSQRMLIGHTRKATVGAVSKATAHPFNYDHIWGAHNGTLHYDWRHLPGGEEKTDSMSLFASVAAVGIEETIAQTKGAYAMVWYDQNDGTLNFLRNKERTLFYGFTDDLKKIIWASEPWMIFVACNNSGNKLFNQGNKENPEYVVSFETDVHFRLKVEGYGKDPVVFEEEKPLVGGTKEVERPKSTWSGYSGKQWTPNTSNKNNSNGNGGQVANPFGQSDGSKNTNSSTSTSSSQEKSPSINSSGASQPQRPTLTLVHQNKNDSSKPSSDTSAKTEIVLVEPDDPQPIDSDVIYNTVTNKEISKEEFERTVDQTCQFCTVDVTYDEAIARQKSPNKCADEGIGRWLSPTTFLCTMCAPFLK